MARNGAGVFSLVAGNPVSTGTTISSTWANNTLSDIASAITQSVAKNGETTMTANLPMGGFKVTGSADGVDPGDLVTLNQSQDVLDESKPMQSYTALRSYTGRATGVRITTPGIAGHFERDATDVTSADNGGTIIVDASSRRWKRLYSGAVNVKWFGAVGDGIANDTVAFQGAINTGNCVYAPSGIYLVDTLNLKANFTIYGDGASSVLKQNSITGASYGTLFVNSSSPTAFVDNIVIRDMQFLGQVVAQGFYEWAHLVSLSGVRYCTIENCTFTGFRGDGLYLGSSPTAGVERHNTNVRIRNCVFDGVNNDNRNGISVIDCDDLVIEKNSFRNCTRSNMPGPIDVEPDSQVFHVVRNIRVIGNHFESSGGNVGCVGFILGGATFTNQPKNFVVANNTFDDPTQRFVTIINNAISYAEPLDITISGNSGKCNRPFDFQTYINGVSITGNSFFAASAGLLGFNVTDLANDVIVSGNTFVCNGSGASSAAVMRSGNNVVFNGNSFNNWYDFNIQVGSVGSTVTNVSIVNNVAISMRGVGYMAQGAGGIDGATCSYSNNIGAESHTFPAWRTDNCGTIANDLSATTFNFGTLPDSFPVGQSVAVINGDTTGPAGTGGNQGTLITYRYPTSLGYEKFTYQNYYHANNTLKLGSFWIRRRSNAANTWTAWAEQAT